jgi:hypothetical protein
MVFSTVFLSLPPRADRSKTSEMARLTPTLAG